MTNVAFWSGLVVRRGRELTREIAERNIAVAKSYGQSERGRDGAVQGAFTLFGRQVDPEIALQLLNLEEAKSSDIAAPRSFAKESQLHCLALERLLSPAATDL